MDNVYMPKVRVSVKPVLKLYPESTPISWMGKEAEFVDNLYTAEYTLAETMFPNITPVIAEEETVIMNNPNVAQFTADMSEYEYIVEWKFKFNGVYPEGTPLGSQVSNQCVVWYDSIFSESDFSSPAVTKCNMLNYVQLIEHYNAAGNRNQIYLTDDATTYGIYPILSKLGNETISNNTITLRSPKVSFRCTAAILAPAIASAIDQNDSTIKITADLYRVKPKGIIRSMYDDLRTLYDE